MITIIDYGMGNSGSIINMLKRVGVESELTSDPSRIEAASRLLLPGVGSFDAAVERMESSGIIPCLEYKVLTQKTPILGICLGMQLLTRASEEGKRAGLGWINGEAKRIPGHLGVKVPHMGWNTVEKTRPSRLTEQIENNTRFYFVHSYYVQTDDPANSILSSTHGLTFSSGIQHDNVMGVQFHPEKSHHYGIQILKAFSLY